MNKEELKKYAVECIEGTEYGIDTDNMTDKEKIEFVLGVFDDEYNIPYNKRSYPKLHERLGQYFRGLPSCYNIDFDDYAISELARNRFGVRALYINEFVGTFFEHVANALISAAIDNNIYISKYL